MSADLVISGLFFVDIQCRLLLAGLILCRCTVTNTAFTVMYRTIPCALKKLSQDLDLFSRWRKDARVI